MKQLKDYTTEQLKVIVYDNSDQIQVLQANIKVVRQEILRRSKDTIKSNGAESGGSEKVTNEL